MKLYAGDIPNMPQYEGLVGLSFGKKSNHIQHDIRNRHPFDDNSIDSYQAEDVFEHIPYEEVAGIINDIYRILKPDGLLRISVPDYRCDVLYKRGIKDKNGNVIYDEGGGKENGHLWFPNIEQMVRLMKKTEFVYIDYLHYYNSIGISVTNKIDYSLGYIQRTPDHDPRVQDNYRAMSIVIDCIK